MALTQFSTPVFELDGTRFINVGSDEKLYPESEFTIAGYVDVNDWKNAVSSQIMGNFYGQGFGLFYNSGVETNTLTLVECSTGIVMNLNTSGKSFFQRQINAPGINPTTYAIDQNSTRYIVDNENHKIHVLDSDSVTLRVIDLPDISDIITSDVDGDNRLWLMDHATRHLYLYNTLGDLLEATPYPPTHNNFIINHDGNPITRCTNEETKMATDCAGNIYHLHGNNLYKNDVIFYHINPSVSYFNIDSNDNIWIAYNENRMLKIKTDGTFIFDKIFHQLRLCRREYDLCKPQNLQFFRERTAMTFSREPTVTGFRNFTWILLKDYNYLIKLDDTGRQLKCVFLPDILDISKFDDLDISKINFCSISEMSDYSANKRFSSSCDSGLRPLIEGKVVVESSCGQISNINLSFDVSDLRAGKHHLALTFNGNTGESKLIIDGTVVDSSSQKGSVFYRYKTPFLIGSRSGKFNALPLEQGVANPVYFIGLVSDLRFYKTALTAGTIQAITTDEIIPQDINWNIELENDRSYVEQIDRFFLHKPPPYKSNKFNLIIKNLGVGIDAQEFIEDKIRQDIDELKPTNTELYKIIWEQ